MDRAHRIGQKKEVQVFRFCTENSIEEKVGTMLQSHAAGCCQLELRHKQQPRSCLRCLHSWLAISVAGYSV